VTFIEDVLKQIREWGCFGYYGYGQGAALRVFGTEEKVCMGICPLSEQCWSTHKLRVDAQYPKLAVIRQRARVTAQTEGRQYEMADYTNELAKDLGRPPVGNQAIDPYLAANAMNINNGIEGYPPTWKA
jgi:hypothetical protein